MHFKITFVLTFICFLFFGCSFVPDELKTAERIIVTQPDSALRILLHLKSEKLKSPSDRALYGILIYEALEKKDKKLLPDSLIDYSINYYQKKKDYLHLAAGYFYKGHKLKYVQRYDEATVLYFKAIDCLQNKNDLVLLGKIYVDMGDVCSLQLDYKEALNKYQISFDCFKRMHNTLDSKFVILYIGRTYRLLNDHKKAQQYYKVALLQMNDSMLCGAIYQEMGIDFYRDKQFDLAQYYLRKSLLYPSNGTNYSIRCNTLSDLLFDLGQYDASFHYAALSLEYPANFYTQRECYRIMVNVEYLRKDIKQMGIYMTNYQSCTDSIRKVELQTKSTVLEKLHATTQESNGTKKSMMLIVSICIIALLFAAFLVVYLYKRNQLKRKLLDTFKMQLSSKQEFVSQGLTKKIEQTRALQADLRKNASAEEREKLDRDLYYSALHLNNWDDFNREMNHAFNNIIVTLKSNYPAINQKELIWCCLQLLDIPHPDRMLLLDATSDSLYKLKQRLAQKFNLKTTKELDLFLRNMTEIKE